MTWIPILMKKPADFEQVLILDEVNDYVIGFYYEAGGFFIGSVDGARIRNPRFWKPLPKLPIQSEQSVAELENTGPEIGDAVKQI